jgi:hypothetical protein
MLYRVHLAWAGFELTMLVVIGTDSCKSKYHTIMTAQSQKDKVPDTKDILLQYSSNKFVDQSTGEHL